MLADPTMYVCLSKLLQYVTEKITPFFEHGGGETHDGGGETIQTFFSNSYLILLHKKSGSGAQNQNHHNTPYPHTCNEYFSQFPSFVLVCTAQLWCQGVFIRSSPWRPGSRIQILLVFYVLGAFLPSLPGWCRNADLLIKTSPE